MKYIATLFFLISSFLVSAQMDSHVGTYIRSSDPVNTGRHTRTLVLQADGTFTYTHHREKHPSQPEEIIQGRGTWKLEKPNVIYFYVDIAKDINETYTLNFTNSKARITRKSPRDKSDRIIPESIRFYESEISWVKGSKLLKE